MTNTTRVTFDTIIGYMALLPLLATILFFVNIIEEVTVVKIVLTIGIALCTVYGILKLARPLVEEVNETGRLL